MVVCPDMPAVPSTDFSQCSTLSASLGCHPGGLCKVKESITDPSTSVTTCKKQQPRVVTIKPFCVCHHLHSIKTHSLHMNFNCTMAPGICHCSSNAVRYCRSDHSQCQHHCLIYWTRSESDTLSAVLAASKLARRLLVLSEWRCGSMRHISISHLPVSSESPMLM